MKPTAISAAKFKAQCLALLDRVARTRRPLVVTKRGKPVAQVVALDEPRRSLEGSILEETDIVSPTGQTWSAS